MVNHQPEVNTDKRTHFNLHAKDTTWDTLQMSIRASALVSHMWSEMVWNSPPKSS